MITPTERGDDQTALLDIAGVATRLAVSERFVRRLVFERRIPFLKIGHFIRFDARDVERWIAAARVDDARATDARTSIGGRRRSN